MTKTKPQPQQQGPQQTSFLGQLKSLTQRIFDHPFWRNDGTLTQWLAHGATELANFIVHGHPAPMYARSVSPPDVQNPDTPTAEQPQEPKPQDTPEKNPEREKTDKQPSLLNKHLNDIGVTVDVELNRELEATLPGGEAPSNSLLEQHMQGMELETPELPEPELELET